LGRFRKGPLFSTSSRSEVMGEGMQGGVQSRKQKVSTKGKTGTRTEGKGGGGGEWGKFSPRKKNVAGLEAEWGSKALRLLKGNKVEIDRGNKIHLRGLLKIKFGKI